MMTSFNILIKELIPNWSKNLSLQGNLIILENYIFKSVQETWWRRKETQRKKAIARPVVLKDSPPSIAVARGVSRISWKQVHHILTVYRVSDHDRETLAIFCFKIATARPQKNAIFSGHAVYVYVCLLDNAGEGRRKEQRKIGALPMIPYIIGSQAFQHERGF